MDDLNHGSGEADCDQLPQSLLGRRSIDPRGTGANRPDRTALSEPREDRVELATRLRLPDGGEVGAAGEDLRNLVLVTTHRVGFRTADVETNDLHCFLP
ncbi:MAG TPA: hypothetical protein VFB83_09415 [Propionibacteriaceae bacterium]|nr:hypothetical protein [Propionibacteriaceae bacterium]